MLPPNLSEPFETNPLEDADASSKKKEIVPPKTDEVSGEDLQKPSVSAEEAQPFIISYFEGEKGDAGLTEEAITFSEPLEPVNEGLNEGLNDDPLIIEGEALFMDKPSIEEGLVPSQESQDSETFQDSQISQENEGLNQDKDKDEEIFEGEFDEPIFSITEDRPVILTASLEGGGGEPTSFTNQISEGEAFSLTNESLILPSVDLREDDVSITPFSMSEINTPTLADPLGTHKLEFPQFGDAEPSPLPLFADVLFYPEEDTAPPPPSFGRRMATAFKEVVETIVPAVIIAVLINFFLAQATRVYGQSMEPNLHTDQRLVVEKVSYKLHSPRRGDVIVLRVRDDAEELLIKRVIALPGETVEVREGHVFIDGEMLEEPYLSQPTRGHYGPTYVPPLHVFVLGDNRGASNDSRSFGPIASHNIIGRAWLSYWPMEDVGLVD